MLGNGKLKKTLLDWHHFLFNTNKDNYVTKHYFLQNIRPICLPKEPSAEPDKYAGHLVYLIGWGSTSDINGKASNVIKRADIKVYSQR
jgi:Trypsin